jgi:hypothetical protein
MKSAAVLGLLLVTACTFGDNGIPLTREDPDAMDEPVDGRSDVVDTPPGQPDGALGPDGHGPADASVDASAPPDAAPPSCTVVPQSGCAGSAPACDITAAADGTLACRAVTAQGGATSHCPALTDCKVGFTCMGDGKGDPDYCAKFCDVDADCSPSTGSRCMNPLQGPTGHPLGVSTCSIACNPSKQTGCPSGMGCLAFDDPAGDFSDCFYMGKTPDGDTCISDADCMPGSSCVNDATGTGACTHFCVVGNDATCPAGLQLCQAFSTPLVIAGVQYGGCGP